LININVLGIGTKSQETLNLHYRENKTKQDKNGERSGEIKIGQSGSSELKLSKGDISRKHAERILSDGDGKQL
jgi:hypothetical protein